MSAVNASCMHVHIQLLACIVPSEISVPTMSVERTGTSNKQVLVIFGDRRRPVIINCSNREDVEARVKEEYQRLMEAVKSEFEDVLNAEEGSSTSESGSFYLQVESSEWGGMIDITSSTVIPDHAVVFLYREDSSHTVGSLKSSEKVLFVHDFSNAYPKYFYSG